MMGEFEAYKVANKALWDHWASLHPGSTFYDNASFIEHQMSLNAIELDLLHDIKGKDVFHLQCHFGQDTISLNTLGAKSITGLDFSGEAIAQAQQLAKDCNVDATFIQRDALDVDPTLTGAFDFVFASYGVVGWHQERYRHDFSPRRLRLRSPRLLRLGHNSFYLVDGLWYTRG